MKYISAALVARAKTVTTAATIAITLPLTSLQAAQPHHNFQQEWQLNEGLKQPESVVATNDGSGFYVSNVNGQPSAMDGNGFISLVSTNGAIKELKWVNGLNGPKGMAAHADKLYVADINELVVIDIKAKKVSQRFQVPEGAFLNDVAVDQQGTVYVSDTATNRIYSLENDNWQLWLEDPLLDNPNGLYVDNNQLLVTSWGKPKDGSWVTEIPGHIQAISLQDKKINDLTNSKPLGNLDGLVKLDQQTYLVSDWMNGKVIQVSTNGDTKTVLELGPGSADMLYLPKSKQLVVPQMLQNNLQSYTVR